MYLKSYYRDLANQVADESTDQYTEVMKELSPGSQPIEKCLDLVNSGKQLIPKKTWFAAYYGKKDEIFVW
mgnify:CR=1 FL=1